MTLIEKIIARAKANRQRIVLPESLEERTLTAADRAVADQLADIILIGNREEIMAKASELGLTHVGGATIIDPATSPKTQEYANLLYELRKKKGMTPEEAQKKVMDPLYFGCLVIKSGDADGQISGALSTTGDTLRPALQIIKCAPGISCVSGAMLMITQKPEYGENGVLVIGDVAVTPMPDASQLAQIAVCTAQTAKSVAGFADPRVAEFFAEIDARHPFKVGMDSCNVPGAINFCKNVLPESLDTCEGGRYSCYIGADMVMVPCSFAQEKRYEVQLGEGVSIEAAWNSEPFERFRDKMRGACPGCEKRALCMGGCPLMPEIVFCGSEKRLIKQ